MVNNVVEIYMDRKADKLVKEKDADIIAIKCEDKKYEIIRNAKKNNPNAIGCDISLASYKFSDKITAKVNARKDKFNADMKALNDLRKDVYAHLELALDFKSKMAVLKDFGIVKDNKIGA